MVGYRKGSMYESLQSVKAGFSRRLHSLHVWTTMSHLAVRNTSHPVIMIDSKTIVVASMTR